MAGVKISNLPVAGAITGTELVAVVQGGVTSRTTASALTGVSSGTVTSVAATVPTFLSVTGSPVTTSGTLAIAYSGTPLPVANGGTNSSSVPAAGAVPYGTGSAYGFTAVGSSGQVLQSNGASAPTWATVTGTGSVTSVAATVPAFLSVTGSPITAAGTLAIAYSGTALAIANGGTNSTTATPTSGGVSYGTGTAYAFSAAGTSGQYLQSNGAGAPTWTTVSGTGTVTSVAATVPAFLSITGSPVTTTGTLAIAYSGTALPVANGGTNATTAGIVSFNNITGYTASGATGTTSTNLVFSASPTFTGTLAAAAVTASTTLGVTGVTSLLGGAVVNSATTNFTQKFQSISSTGQSNAIFFKTVANATGPDITIGKSRNGSSDPTAFTAVISGDSLGAINFAGTDGSALITPGSISAVVDGAVSAGTVPAALYFATGTSGGGGTKLAIASSGVVTMASYGAGSATFSAAGVISSVSDETYKIKDGVVADPMSMIMALEPGYYFGKPEANMGPGRQLGFYAQNVRAAIGPEAAPDPEPSKPWGYFDRSVLAVAIEAIKVQKAQIDALTARIVALEAK